MELKDLDTRVRESKSIGSVQCDMMLIHNSMGRWVDEVIGYTYSRCQLIEENQVESERCRMSDTHSSQLATIKLYTLSSNA